MKLKNISKEELEAMTYSEITEIILNEKGSKMKIVDVFKKICSALEMSDAEFENKIADYFELISTDKNFVVLDKGYCDLKKKHNTNVIIEEEEEIVEPESIEEPEEFEENNEDEEEDIYYDNSSDDDDVDDSDDELDDFIVIEDEEETSM